MSVCRQNKTATRRQLFAYLLHGLHIPHHAAAVFIAAPPHLFLLCQPTPIFPPKALRPLSPDHLPKESDFNRSKV